ncbi:hypothetical protein IE81DRAFT_296276, partial [Ceraceosorus guamensis]
MANSQDDIAGPVVPARARTSEISKASPYTNDQETAKVTQETRSQEASDASRDASSKQQLKRTLSARHLVLISLGGVIGPGLLVGSGTALSEAGPVGAILAYLVVGSVTWATMMSVGELATAFPASQSHLVDFASRFLDPAAGFVLGFLYWTLWCLVLANELVAVGILFAFWEGARVVPQGAWIAIFLVFFLCISLLGVATWGELEFWLASIKILFLIVFFIISIVINTGGTGQGYIGFRYFRNPGSFTDFPGFVSVLTLVATQFAGTEITATCAAEARRPERAVPRAVTSVMWRILVFYVGTAFFIGLNVPSNDDRLANASSKAAASPLTIAMQRGAIEAAASAINAIIIVSIVSAGNSSLYVASRTLAAMARERLLPAFLGWTTKKTQVPVPALLVSAALSLISLLSVSSGSSTTFTRIYSISGISILLVWALIAASHIRMRSAMKVQGRSVSELRFKAPLWPVGAWYALIMNCFLALIQGYGAFAPTFDIINFVVFYIMLPVSIVLYIGFKIVFQTRIPRTSEIDLDTGSQLTHELDGHSE